VLKNKSLSLSSGNPEEEQIILTQCIKVRINGAISRILGKNKFLRDSALQGRYMVSALSSAQGLKNRGRKSVEVVISSPINLREGAR
jgi:hypothetical protein